MAIKKIRADEVRVGHDLWYHGVVESVTHYGPMFGEEYGYTRNVEIVSSFKGDNMARVQHIRGDLPVKVW